MAAAQRVETLESGRLPERDRTVDEEPVSIAADDRYRIRGVHYIAHTERPIPCVVVLNSGAGIPAKHYRHLARFLARSGIPTLSYDYRGIGQSRPATLRGFAATIEDWAELDCSAAIQWMRNRHPASSILAVGHSIGSLFFGGASNSGELSGVTMISPHTGFYGDYRKKYRVPMALFWHGVMPALTSVVGFFPGRLLRLGDDIPKGVALQWAHRRKQLARTRGADHRLNTLVERFSELRMDALIIRIGDDSFSTEAAVIRVQQMFPRLTVRQWLISPSQLGVDKLGHFGFFRRSAASAVWPDLAAHLRGQAAMDARQGQSSARAS